MSVALLNEAIKDNVEVNLKISKLGDKVLVTGETKASISLLCSRCLKNFSYPLHIKFDTEYIPFKELLQESEYELKREELDISFYRDDQIDIEQLVKEQLFLAIPMKPLCKSDCQGICPKCGKDLNERACECKIEEIDPRLAILKKLKN
ncbi:MAG: DUF177 domain-containing protein [Nitrospirae bacterium]|nr:DUF177 domain-containing protein [Nitrospirota bacterium]